MENFYSNHIRTGKLTFLVIIIMISGVSCSSDAVVNPQTKNKPLAPASSILKKPGSSFNDTLLVVGKSAVLYSPDSMQLQKIMQVNNSQTYAMLTHDCHYQMENARIVLKNQWPKIKVYEVSRQRFLKFVKADRTTKLIDLNNYNDICGLFLFDEKKDPVLADMPNISTVLNFYFD